MSSLCLGLVVQLLAQPLRVYAQDTEDLFNVYGMTLGGPIKTDIEEEIESAEKEIQDKTTQQSIYNIQNSITSEYMARREAEMNNILSDVSVYQTRNENIREAISENILDSPIDKLVQLDGQYKSNVKSMDTLLSVLNGYAFSYSTKDESISLSDVELRLSEAQRKYADALDAYDLGDVTNIKWVLPNDRYITSNYGYRVDPLNSKEIRFHAGTDYRAQSGTPVGALFNGVVVSCGWSDTIGNFVTVQSGDNVKYLVCHCSEILVSKGQYVRQYDTIALSGGTGSRSTGPHLHLALYLNGVTYDVNRLFDGK